MTSPLPSLSSPSPPPPPPPLRRGKRERRQRGRGWSGLTSTSEYCKRVSEVISLHNAHQQYPIATTVSVLLLHFCSLSRAQRNGECVSVSLAAGKGLLRECTPVGAHQHDSEEQRGSLHLLPGTPQGGMRLWDTSLCFNPPLPPVYQRDGGSGEKLSSLLPPACPPHQPHCHL